MILFTTESVVMGIPVEITTGIGYGGDDLFYMYYLETRPEKIAGNKEGEEWF